MRTLAEEILTNNRSFVEELAEDYPTYFDTNNLTITQDNYFLVVSKYRLGTSQTHQFQSGEQYGANWHWGSKCTEDNGSITCDDSATVARSALAEMPRGYYKEQKIYGYYYNWFSATAEAGKYSMSVAGNATNSDSVCPKGWALSAFGDTTTDKSYPNLINFAYSLGNNYESAVALTAQPFSFVLNGLYSIDGQARYRQNAYGYYNLGVNGSTGARLLDILPARGYAHVYPASSTHPLNGAAVRCVKK